MRSPTTAALIVMLFAIVVSSLYTLTHTFFKQINSRFTITGAFSDEYLAGQITLGIDTKPHGSPSPRLVPHRINSNIRTSSKSNENITGTKAPLTKPACIKRSSKSHTAVIGIETAKKAPESNNRFFAAAYAASRETESGCEDYNLPVLWANAKTLRAYAQRNGYSTRYGFIVDMSMKSGKKRFFVIDLYNMSILNQGVVAHGRGADRITLNKKYSNEKGSNCTSLGMYKIGKLYNGIFGPSYKLHGLDETNSNAYERAIVLHSMNNIPDREIDFPITQSEGCPAVCPQFLKYLHSIIKLSDKPLLMWIYDTSVENSSM